MEGTVFYSTTDELGVSGTTYSLHTVMRSQPSERVTVPGVDENRLDRTLKVRNLTLFYLCVTCTEEW